MTPWRPSVANTSNRGTLQSLLTAPHITLPSWHWRYALGCKLKVLGVPPVSFSLTDNHCLIRITAERYHDLMNQFPHKVLTTHRRTLPISLVWVFIAVAAKLGTECKPVAFPGQVVAYVPHPNSGEPIWVDVFDYDNGPIKSREDLTTRLAGLGFPPHEFDSYIMPCSTMEISQRIISNVMHAVNLELTTPTRPSRLAIQVSLYSGFVWTAAMFPERATEFSSSLIASAGFAFPLDFGPIILGSIVPTLPAGMRSMVDRACREAMAEELSAPETMVRSGGVRFFVGMLFRHEGRVAAVTGWNVRPSNDCRFPSNHISRRLAVWLQMDGCRGPR